MQCQVADTTELTVAIKYLYIALFIALSALGSISGFYLGADKGFDLGESSGYAVGVMTEGKPIIHKYCNGKDGRCYR